MEGIERNITKDTENPESHHVVSGDVPIAQPDDDQLGYASFAKHLADSICRMPVREGLVVAIYGPWGSAHGRRRRDHADVPYIFPPWRLEGHTRHRQASRAPPHYPPSRMSTLQAGMCRDVPPAGADRLHVSSAGACALACGVPERLGLLRPRDRPQHVLDGEPGYLLPQREAVGRGAPEVHAGVHPRVGVFLPRL
jgi:hypothetical protein